MRIDFLFFTGMLLELTLPLVLLFSRGGVLLCRSRSFHSRVFGRACEGQVYSGIDRSVGINERMEKGIGKPPVRHFSSVVERILVDVRVVERTRLQEHRVSTATVSLRIAICDNVSRSMS